MRHWFVGDLHFGHGNILKYCRRTMFMTPDEKRLLNEGANFSVSKDTIWKMNDAFIEDVNKSVAKEDILWCLGDWTFSKGYYLEDSRRNRDCINCDTVHMIWGNHDQRKKISHLFTTNHELVMIAINNDNGEYIIGEEEIGEKIGRGRKWQRIILCHYAMAVWNGSHKGNWQLYGHSHAGAEPWMDKNMLGRRSMDVGVDNAFKILGEYRPFSFEEIKKIMDGRPGFSMNHGG